MTSVTIGSSVTSIGDNAFGHCLALQSAIVPNSVTSMGEAVFSCCSSLTSLVLPDGLTSIAKYMLSGCSSLSSIVIPQSVTSIAETSLAYCDNVKTVYCYAEAVPKTDPLAFSDEYAMDEDTYISKATLYVPEAAVDDYKATAPWSGFSAILPLPDMTGIETTALHLQISAHGGTVAVSSAESEGRQVCVYSFDGKALGAAIIRNGLAVIHISTHSSQPLIVKIGSRSVKISYNACGKEPSPRWEHR